LSLPDTPTQFPPGIMSALSQCDRTIFMRLCELQLASYRDVIWHSEQLLGEFSVLAK
jgi:hypothetical protein